MQTRNDDVNGANDDEPNLVGAIRAAACGNSALTRRLADLSRSLIPP